MSLDFSKPITAYELIAIIISLIAIFIPIIKFLYNKYFKKLELDYVPQNNIITLFFNESGAYVQTGFSLYCKNKGVILRSIEAKIIRKRDNAELNLSWSTILSPTTQQIGNGAIISNNDTAGARMVSGDSVNLFMLEFINKDTKATNELYSIHDKKMNILSPIDYTNITYQDAIEKFKSTCEYNEYYKDVAEHFFWREDEYELQIITNYDNNKKYIKKYKFIIDEFNHQQLKENIENSLVCRIKNHYMIPAGFNVRKIEYTEIK